MAIRWQRCCRYAVEPARLASWGLGRVLGALDGARDGHGRRLLGVRRLLLGRRREPRRDDGDEALPRGVARERVPDVWWKSIHLCIGQTARVYDRAAKRRHEFKFVERSSVAYGFGRRSGIFAPNPRGGNSSRVSTAADRLTPSA